MKKALFAVFFLLFFISARGFEGDANLIFTLAKFYANSGQYDTAIEKLSELLKQDPDNEKARGLIEEYRNLRDNKQTRSDRPVKRKLTAYERKMVSEKEKKVAEYTENGNFAEAIELLTQVIDKVPHYPKAYYEMAIIKVRLGKPEEALEFLEKNLSMEPKNSYSWFYKGTSLFSLGRIDESFEALNRAIEYDPDNLYFKIKVGQYYMKDGKFDRAEEKVSEALLINEMSEEAKLLLADLKLYKKEFGKASAIYAELREQNPKSARIAANHAYAKIISGSIEDGGQILDSLKGADEVPEYNVALGVYNLRRNQRAAAVNALSKAIEEDPDNVKALYHLAMFYETMADFKKTEQYLKTLLASEPYHQDAVLLLGRVYEKQNRDGEALNLYSALFAKGNHSFEVADPLGKLLSKRKMYTEAINVYKSAYREAKGSDRTVLREKIEQLGEMDYDLKKSAEDALSPAQGDTSDSLSF